MNRCFSYLAKVCLCAVLVLPIGSCTYFKNVFKQSGYAKIHETDPSLRNLKHLLDRQTYFVYGRLVDGTASPFQVPLAVAAFSDQFRRHELVDVAHVAQMGTQFGLNLPEGRYQLLVLSDMNANGMFEQTEVVGRRHVVLQQKIYPEMVADNVDIGLARPELISWDINIPVPEETHLQESIFFPKGSIRSLSDPLFDEKITQLGLYEPAAFYEIAPTMFYALEEESYKIPVIFVHGIGGSPRDFSSIVAELDDSTYKPWFFYYASGGDLDQLAAMFFEIFLSGHAVFGNVRVIVVAHSMGGLVVREAFNKYEGNGRENRVDLFLSIATPFGGHPAAVKGEQHAPLVLPSWRDLNPEGAFIKKLYRRSLSERIRHELVFAYGGSKALKFGENSDDVVPLSSQLYPAAQREALSEFGVNATHTGVLEDADAISHIIQAIEQVKLPFPQSHLTANQAGGFDIPLGNDYSKVEKYYIHNRGKYMKLLALGTLDTLGDPALEHFVAVAQGRAKAESPAESAWLKFVRDFPEYLK